MVYPLEEVARGDKVKPLESGAAALTAPLLTGKTYSLFEIARVVVHFDHVPRFIVNANHGVPIRLAKLARFWQNIYKQGLNPGEGATPGSFFPLSDLSVIPGPIRESSNNHYNS